MTTKEAISELQRRGIYVTVWELRGLIDRGEVPRPRLNSALQFDWAEADLQNVAAVMEVRGMEVAK